MGKGLGLGQRQVRRAKRFCVRRSALGGAGKGGFAVGPTQDPSAHRRLRSIPRGAYHSMGGEWGLVSLPVFKTGAPSRDGGRVRFPSASARNVVSYLGFAAARGFGTKPEGVGKTGEVPRDLTSLSDFRHGGESRPHKCSGPSDRTSLWLRPHTRKGRYGTAKNDARRRGDDCRSPRAVP
jgi:hypothetical protein